MARLTVLSPAAQGPQSIEAASVELRQLLSRLQRNLLHPDPERERRLRRDEYERARIGANLEYARKALTKLEQEALAIKAPARRIDVQAGLNHQRELYEILADRLEDLKKIALDDDEDDDDSAEDDDVLSQIIATPSESTDSKSVEMGQSEIAELKEHKPAPIQPTTTHSLPATSILSQPEPTPTPVSITQPPAPVATQTSSTETTQTLRSRQNAAPSPSPSTSSAHTTARAALFANRRKPTAATPQTSTATAEAILDHQRAEQDQLSESILKMAGALKASSHKFADTLEADKDVVGRATEGMDKTERGMEAAKGRMGALRRMTEGKGWWGRMILFAWVYGLMVALILLVFVFPKLRF